MKAVVGATVCLLALAVAARAETYAVGAGKTYAKLADLPALKPGDVVEVSGGTYNEYALLRADGTAEKPITIRGMGAPRPVLDGTGLDVTGAGRVPRALLQIEGDHYVIENLEFRNAKNGHNGAGIRINGAKGTTIRDCGIFRCEMGIMSNDNDDLLVERCEIAENGNPTGFNGLAHNVYIGGDKATFRNCYIHDAIAGINFKSRGRYTELLYNWIADGNEAEISLVDSDWTKKPGGALVLGNVIVSKPNRTGNQIKFIDWGQDVGGERNGTLYLLHNTLVAGTPRVQFLWSTSPNAKVIARNNVFVGSGNIAGRGAEAMSGSHNVLPVGATAPVGFTGSVSAADPGFVDAKGRGFGLKADSPARDAGMTGLTYVDGKGETRPVAPESEYVPHRALRPRPSDRKPDAGAYEHSGR